MKVFISTGELSGDIYARKVSEVWSRRRPIDFVGMAGPQAHLPQCRPNDALHLMGFSGVVSALPRLLALKKALARQCIEEKPDLAILVDSPDFHLPLLKDLRCGGYRGPVVYLCPPTVWAWRAGRAEKLRRYQACCVTLFDFEALALQNLGVEAHWFGHPLLDEDLTSWAQGDDMRKGAVALLPGSRTSEIKALLPLLIQVAQGLKERGYEPFVSQAPHLSPEVCRLFDALPSWLAVDRLGGRHSLAVCDFALGASGTLATEALLLGKPMAVLYKGTVLERFIFKYFVKTPYVSVPNILAQGEIYPEFLGPDCRLDALLEWVDKLPTRRGEVEGAISRAQKKLGQKGVVDRWVDLMEQLV